MLKIGFENLYPSPVFIINCLLVSDIFFGSEPHRALLAENFEEVCWNELIIIV